MSLPLIDRANEIISEALNFGTISFTNGKMTTLKPDTVLNLAKAICTQKNLKAPDEIIESNLPDDMSFESNEDIPPFTFDLSLVTESELEYPRDSKAWDLSKSRNEPDDLTQLSFPFMKHEGE